MGNFLEWILESSLLIIMILGIRKIFMGKIRYAGIYALWIIVFLRFMIPVNFISTPFSVGNIVTETMTSWKTVATARQSQTASDASESDQTGSGILQTENTNQKLSLKQKSSKTSEAQTKNTLSGQTTEPMSQNAFGNFIHRIPWRLVLAAGWGIVAGVLFLWLVISNVCLIRKLKQHRTPYGTKNQLKIYTVSGIQTPCLYGFFRPVIYLPEALIAGKHGNIVGQDELEQIITHEYVHYLHKDHLWAILRMVLASVYWFDPFLWLAISCSKKDAELFCDETVIRLLGEEHRFHYGEMLVRLAGDTSWSDFRYSMMPMSKKGREMETRIRAISAPKRYSKRVLIPLLAVVCLTAGITCSAGIQPPQKIPKALMTENKTIEPKNNAGNTQDNSLLSTSTDPFSNESQLKNEEETVTTPEQNDTAGQPSDEQEYGTASADSGTYQEAFHLYIEAFTKAVNTGKTKQLQQALATDTEVYEQQCALAKNYYKRGIREEVKSCSISSVKKISDEQVEIQSKENIKVFYGDNTSKMVKQKYQYTCEFINQNWIITKMGEIQAEK